jgi:hypothetical protein
MADDRLTVTVSPSQYTKLPLYAAFGVGFTEMTAEPEADWLQPPNVTSTS